MPVIAPPTLTPAGLSPDRADRPTFVARSIARDEFIKNHQIPELQSAIDNVYNNSQIAYASGLTAETAASAQAAPMWVSGTTYALGDTTWSPITYVAYRRIVAGAGTTDPSADATNWAAIITPITAGGTGTNYGVRQLQSIDYTLSGNTLTLKLNPTNLDFRSTTLTTGAPTNVAITSQITTTISSGSTGGTTSAVQSDIDILAINNAGTMELAWVKNSGALTLDETGLITTVAEGGAGGADSADVFYSTTARTNVAYRKIGLFRSTQTTAGTWAQSPSLVQGIGGLALIPQVTRQFMIVEDQKAAGSAGGSSSGGDNIRVLNTVVSNTITGASLASNQVTLPAGTYLVNARAPALTADNHRIRLVNVTDASVLVLGGNSFASATYVGHTDSTLDGIFTITAAKVLNLTHYFTSAVPTNGLGTSIGDTRTAIFSHITFEKV